MLDRSKSPVIAEGLARIRSQFDVPAGFVPELLADALNAAGRSVGTSHVDRTGLPFATLDPASSTDLDQAFCLERSGDDVVLRYAIADVGWFVEHGSSLDREAWTRGATMYLPGGRAPLYPTALSEGAASLLPDGPRPAVVFVVRVAPDGTPRLDGVERAMIKSRAKLAYESVTFDDLPAELGEFARRMALGEQARGATRIEMPEQEVEGDEQSGFRVAYRARLKSEDANASMSLAANMAVAQALYAARTGLFRVMDEPEGRGIGRLRHTARALGVEWPAEQSLTDFERGLVNGEASHAAMALAVRRAGGGARYEPFRAGVVPWHAAVAATYAHTTAPLRRLADRYVILAALAISEGRAVPEEVTNAFDELPSVMQRSDAMGNQIDRAVIDLVEAAMMMGKEGRTFTAVVTDTDERGARVQLCDIAVVARVSARNLEPGDEVRVKLVEAVPAERRVEFERVA